MASSWLPVVHTRRRRGCCAQMSREGAGPRTADRNSRAARFGSAVSLTDFRRRPVLRDRPGRGSVKPPGAEDVFPSGLVEHSFWGAKSLSRARRRSGWRQSGWVDWR